MKRFVLAVCLALGLLCGNPALADEIEVEVVTSDIIVEPGDSLYVDVVVTVSGTVWVIAVVEISGELSVVEAQTEVYYEVEAPDGTIVATGSVIVIDSDVGDPAQADASQTYDWQTSFELDQAGDWVVKHGGRAKVRYGPKKGKKFNEQDSERCRRKFSASPVFGDAAAMYAGQFLVTMCGWGSRAGYRWQEGWTGKTLAEPVLQVATYHYDGHVTYALMIPEGTIVEGYYGGRVQHLEFKVIGGEFYFAPNLTLSQPALLYELVTRENLADGLVLREWVEVLSFTQVLNGKAS